MPKITLVRQLASILTLGLLAGCVVNVNVDSVSPSDEEAIRAAGSEWTRYYQGADLDGLMTLYQPDAIVALHEQPALFGKPAIRNYFSTRLGGPEAEFDLEYEAIRVEGELAYIVSKYWLTIGSGPDAIRDAGRSLLVYRRGADGQWRIEADIDQDTPDVTFDGR